MDRLGFALVTDALLIAGQVVAAGYAWRITRQRSGLLRAAWGLLGLVIGGLGLRRLGLLVAARIASSARSVTRRPRRCGSCRTR